MEKKEEIPNKEPEMKKSFIEKTLGQRIYKIEVTNGSKAGDNSLGSILAIKVTTKAKKEIHLLYKSMPQLNPEQKRHIVNAGFFRNENALYQFLVPRIDDLLKSRNTSGLPLPKYYAGKNDDENDYLLLEDLRHQGYNMSDKLTGLNFQEVSLLLKTIAEFHASTYCFIKNEGEKIFQNEDMKTFVNSFFVNDSPSRMKRKNAILRFNLNNAIILLEENHYQELSKKLRRQATAEGLQRLDTEARLSTDKLYFPCIIHGDLWVNNILFKYENGNRNKPVDVKLIDFQLSRRSHIYEDLGYFFLSSTTHEFREEHLARALFIYYEAFIKKLKVLKCPVPANFTRGVFIDHYFGHLLQTYAFMCFVLPLHLCEPTDTAPLNVGKDTCINGDSAHPSKSNSVNANGTTSNGDAVDSDDKGPFVQSQFLLQQMRKTPWAVQRLIEMTKELALLQIL